MTGISDFAALAPEFHMRRLFADSDSDMCFKELTARLRSECGVMRRSFFDPVVGMGAAAKFEDDGSW